MKNELRIFLIVSIPIILIPIISIVILENIDKFPPFNKIHYKTLEAYTKTDFSDCKFKYVDIQGDITEYILKSYKQLLFFLV